MDLIQIAKSDYTPKALVENHSSLIWTERFQDPGEFELHTQAVASTRALLPELSFCSLRNTNVVMMVESHEISLVDGVNELVVKGRELDSFLENRTWTNGKYNKAFKMAKHYTVRQAVEVWVWNAIANGTGNDRINPAKAYLAANQLPNVIVTDSVPPSTDGDILPRKVQNGNVYEQMRTFLTSGKLGIRIIRPRGTTGRKVNVSSDGTFSTNTVSDIAELRFDIFVGRDVSDKVVFSFKAGHLDDPKYLFSVETFKTGAFVDGDVRDHYYTDPDILPGPNTGWNRRDVYVDGGSMADPEYDSVTHTDPVYPPGATDAEKKVIDDANTAHNNDLDAASKTANAAKLAAAKDDFEDSLVDVGLKAVRKEGRRVNAIDAQINPLINFKYGKDYGLGDRVMVQGQYGVKEKKWVTEFIRTQDENGEIGFPTLSETLS